MPLPIGLGFLMLPMALPRASFLVLPMALDLAVREVVLVNMKTIKRLAISKNPIQDFVGHTSLAANGGALLLLFF